MAGAVPPTPRGLISGREKPPAVRLPHWHTGEEITVASTRDYGGGGQPVGEQSIGALVATATRDLSVLIQSEIELAKAELAEQAKRAGLGAGLLGGAGAFAMLALLVLCFAAGFGLSAGASIPVWAGFLCVGGLFVLIAGGLGALGARALKQIGGPELTMSTVKSSLASLRHPRRAPAPPALPPAAPPAEPTAKPTAVVPNDQ